MSKELMFFILVANFFLAQGIIVAAKYFLKDFKKSWFMSTAIVVSRIWQIIVIIAIIYNYL